MTSLSKTSSAERAITLSSFRLERVRLLVIATLVSLTTASVVIGYRDTYPTTVDRLRFSTAFKGDLALRLFYGVPHDLASVGGYAEFRLVGLLSVLAGGWAVFAAARALRGEEESGRWELLLAGALTRRSATAAVLRALLLEWAAIWFATAGVLAVVGVVPGDLTLREAALLAFSILAPALLFGPIGALACQLVSTPRATQALAGGALAAALLLRIAADTAGVGWLRWVTPLGWAEELHPVTGPRPAVFALFIVSSALVTLVTLAVATRRDVGAGLWSRHRDGASSTRLLGSTTQVATREELPTLIVWVISAGTFALLLGAFSKTIAEDAARSDLNHALGTAVTTATGYLSLSFVLFSLVVTLFAATHILGMNGEESSGRLETLFALPVSRTSWMVGRLALAVCSSIALGLLIGVLAWVGAAGRDAGVSLGSLIAAGANTVPAALLFIGVGALLFGVAPRHAGGITMTLVGAAFLWQLVGAALGVPAWVLTVSPFAHVAAVPEGAFDSQGAVAMILIGAVALAAGVIEFGRRDIQEG